MSFWSLLQNGRFAFFFAERAIDKWSFWMTFFILDDLNCNNKKTAFVSFFCAA